MCMNGSTAVLVAYMVRESCLGSFVVSRNNETSVRSFKQRVPLNRIRYAMNRGYENKYYGVFV